MNQSEIQKFLTQKVSILNGVGIKIKQLLKRKRIEKISDLIWNLPESFTDRSNIKRITLNKKPKNFYYKNRGYLATIGRSNAIVDFGWFTLKGMTGWIFWSIIHIYFLIGFRNRLFVFINWIWSYITFSKSARLIIDERQKKL